MMSRIGRNTEKTSGRCAATIPSGTPMATDTAVEDTTSASVSIVAPQ